MYGNVLVLGKFHLQLQYLNPLHTIPDIKLHTLADYLHGFVKPSSINWCFQAYESLSLKNDQMWEMF